MRCWTCESKLEGPPKILGGTRQMFTCHTCTGLIELGRIREKIETSQAQSLGDALRLFEESTRGPQEIVSAIEWGFEDIGWNLDQMTGVLKSIDTTLKTPSLIKANEWRQMAEELRRRGVLDESEEFFLKSLRANPLDYRTYIGLGKTYLQMAKNDLARTYWEKSLPHAPEEEIDYKSYSYRLIGRIYFCEENYQQAALALKKAIELSPRYYPGHYDYAQYCALVGDKKNCLSSLKIAVEKEPLPLGLVRQERNLQVFKKEIENLLRTVDPNELNFRERLKRELQKDPLWYVPEEVEHGKKGKYCQEYEEVGVTEIDAVGHLSADELAYDTNHVYKGGQHCCREGFCSLQLHEVEAAHKIVEKMNVPLEMPREQERLPAVHKTCQAHGYAEYCEGPHV